MKATCPTCGQHVEFPDEHLGTEADCPNCATAFVLSPTSLPVAQASIGPPGAMPSNSQGEKPNRGNTSVGTAAVSATKKPAEAVGYLMILLPALYAWQKIGGFSGLVAATFMIFFLKPVTTGIAQFAFAVGDHWFDGDTGMKSLLRGSYKCLASLILIAGCAMLPMATSYGARNLWNPGEKKELPQSYIIVDTHKTTMKYVAARRFAQGNDPERDVMVVLLTWMPFAAGKLTTGDLQALEPFARDRNHGIVLHFSSRGELIRAQVLHGLYENRPVVFLDSTPDRSRRPATGQAQLTKGRIAGSAIGSDPNVQRGVDFEAYFDVKLSK